MYSPDITLAGQGGNTAPASRRFALKAATAEAHERVEGVVRAAGMFDTLDGYRRYVAATWALRTRFEGLLDMNGAAAIWPLWPTRRIAHLAEQDMADLGILPRPEEFAPSTLSSGELLGVLYVLEGSSLGARLLLRSVSRLGLSADNGARHLHAQAGEASAWRGFVEVLEASPQPPCHEMARSVFDAFAAAYAMAAR
jgi:heme oxygenase